METIKVLFVCMGNSCRSPIAEAVFNHKVMEMDLEQKWKADSAAIGHWNVGNYPEERARRVLDEHNVKYDHRSRLLTRSDFDEFQYIFGMDYYHIQDLELLAPETTTARIMLLGDFDPLGEKIIRDPYFDEGSLGFEKCYQQCVRCLEAFLKQHSI